MVEGISFFLSLSHSLWAEQERVVVTYSENFCHNMWTISGIGSLKSWSTSLSRPAAPSRAQNHQRKNSAHPIYAKYLRVTLSIVTFDTRPELTERDKQATTTIKTTVVLLYNWVIGGKGIPVCCGMATKERKMKWKWFRAIGFKNREENPWQRLEECPSAQDRN